MDDIVRITVLVKNISDIDAVDDVFKTYLPSYVPSRTSVAVAALPKGALVQIEALVSHGEGTIPNAPQTADLIKVAKNTENAPTSSLSTQTVAFSHYNHISAQLPMDPKTGEIVAGSVKEQTRKCLINIKPIVEGVNHVMGDVVKIETALKNIADTDAVDEIYTIFFLGAIPARRITCVSALPGNALFQIDAVVSNAEGSPPNA